MKFLDSETNHDGNKYPGRMRFHNSLDPVKKKKNEKTINGKARTVSSSPFVCATLRERYQNQDGPEYITTTYCSI